MKSLLFPALLAVSGIALADGPPCRMPLSARPETVPALSRTVPEVSELEIQKQCLEWEYNLPQKAEFIPPYGDPRPPIRTRVVVPPVVVEPPTRDWVLPPKSGPFGWPATFSGLFERQTPWLPWSASADAPQAR